MSASEPNTERTLRIMDASLNRASEGLRFLEDTARFVLNDVSLTAQLKAIRHLLVISDFPFQKQLVQSRDSTGDVGVALEVAGGKKQKDLPLAIVANSRRVQEAIRTLEELAKISGSVLPLDSGKYQQTRFEIYTIEKNLISRILRKEQTALISGLYPIIDTQALKGRNHLEMAREIIRGGAKIIQLRDKVTIKRDLLPIAQKLKTLCIESGVIFIVNDALDIALAVEADGLHIGQEDIPMRIARKLVPIDMLIGCSVFNVEQAQQAVADGADYVGVGAIFPTPSKDTVILGPDELRNIKRAINVPVVAIGGITKSNIAEVKATGADSVAVISAILGAESPEKATRELINTFEG